LFEKIKNPVVKQVDLGMCNGRYFMVGVGLGFDGSVARQTQQNKSGFLPTKLKYYLAILRNIFRFRSFNCMKTINGKTSNEKAFMIAVANGPYYGGGFKIAPKANCHDGLLDMVHIGEMTTLKRPFYIPKVQKGKHLDLPFVRYEQIAKVQLSSVDGLPIPAHADGEIISAAFYDVEVKAAALTVLV
jgi:diacylglycerol kinase family enzyme